MAAKQNPADSCVADLLELANVRDVRRAVTFHVLASAVLDRGGQVTIGELGEALPELESAFPLQVRAIWTLAVDGYFGAAGRLLAQRRVTEFVAGRSAEGHETGVAGWMTLAPSSGRAPERSSDLPDAKAHRDAFLAGDRLAALREWLVAALATPAEQPATDLDPAVKRGLELLVDEGSEVEVPLLAREPELRAMIGSGGAGGTPETWESSAGDTAELLKQDLLDGTRPGRRTIVVRAHGQQIVEAAERLAERATARITDEVEVRTPRGTVTITECGPVGSTLDLAEHRLAPSLGESARAKRFGVVAATVGVALLILALFAGWGWVIPAVAVLGVAVVRLRAASKAEVAARADSERAKRELRAEADRQVELLAEVAAELTRRRDRAEDDLAAIRAALG